MPLVTGMSRKGPHGGRDFLDARLQSEVAGIEELNRRVGIIATVRFGSGRDKERVVAAPNRKKRRLRLPKIFVKGRVELDVVGIVEEQIQLNVHVSRSRNHRRVKRITLRRDCLRMRNA